MKKMTADTFKMETMYIMKHPDIVMQMVKRLSSDKRKEQLKRIIIKSSELSLRHRVYIQMLIGPEGKKKMFYSSFELPDFTAEPGTTLVVERCLKLMDKMAEGVEV
jgi:hypothetical protein